MADRKQVILEFKHAFEAVLSTSQDGRPLAAVPLLDNAVAASAGLSDQDIYILRANAAMIRSAIRENRIGPARRYAGASLRGMTELGLI